MSKTITVVATRKGLYGSTRKPGDTFDVPANLFSERWMAKVGTKEAKAAIVAAKGRDSIDHLTGERVAAGGSSEQIAVLNETNSRLNKRLAELEAKLAAVLDSRVTDSRDEVKAPDEEGDSDPADPAEEQGADTEAPAARRTRRSKE
jgi:hypothetical protein